MQNSTGTKNYKKGIKGLSSELQYSHMHNCKIKCFVPLITIQCDMKKKITIDKQIDIVSNEN